MPVHEVGYRPWEGKTRSAATRWTSITRRGVALAHKSWILRRFFYFVYVPLIYYAPVFLAIGLVSQEDSRTARTLWTQIAKEALGRGALDRLVTDSVQMREAAWSIVFFMFFAYTGAILTFIVVAFVGPPLVSRDIRSRTFLIYFSKPISVGEYILGKAAVVGSYVVLVTLVPAIVLYVISIGFAPSIGALFDTWRTVGKIVVAGAVLAVPVSLVMMAMSSVVRNARYATFAWIVVCIFGELAYRAMFFAFRSKNLAEPAWLSILSPRQTFLVIYSHIFDVRGSVDMLGNSHRFRFFMEDLKEPAAFGWCIVFLMAVSGVSYWIVRSRVRGILRA